MLKTQNKLLNGAFLQPDGWKIGEKVTRDRSSFKDDSFPGCDYRVPAGGAVGYNLAINLEISGRKSHITDFGNYKTRVKIEYVGDGEPSTYSGGWIFTNYPLH